MPFPYCAQSPRKAIQVRINQDLLLRAQALNINLSTTLEQALLEFIRLHRQEQWLAENQAAIADYNELVATQGSFGDNLGTG